MIADADTRRRLTALAERADADIDLAEAALTLAAMERPGVAREPYRRHLTRIADEVGRYAGTEADDIALRAEALRQVIARRYGYAGTEDSYADPDGSNLMRVIDHRHGLPVVLGVIYLDVARRLGWEMAGLDFPARFLVRLDHAGTRVILDPFDGAPALETPQLRDLLKAAGGSQVELTPAHYAELGNRDILLRIQNNIKLRQLRADRLDAALEAVETMLLFAPDVPSLWREAGLLNARLDHVREAVAALEEYLRRSGAEAARYRTSVLLQELRGRL